MSTRKTAPKKPASLPVLGLPVKITWDRPDRFDSKDDYGQCVPLERTLDVNPAKCTTPAMVESTFFHELVHMVLGLSGQSESLSDPQEEGIVLALENGLYPVICELVQLGFFRTNNKE